MKAFVLILLIAVTSFAQGGDKEVFSIYDPVFRLASISESPRTIQFDGELTVKGEIILRFDEISPSEAGELIFADFVLDREFIPMFPQVIDGFYPKPLESIFIINMDESLAVVLGKVDAAKTEGGGNLIIKKRGTAILHQYGMSVEGDSRQYWATLKSFEPEP